MKAGSRVKRTILPDSKAYSVLSGRTAFALLDMRSIIPIQFAPAGKNQIAIKE